MTDGALAGLLSGSTEYGGEVAIDPSLHGFGGVHGGLALALAADAMARQSPIGTLRSVSGNFVRSLDGPLTVAVESVRTGRTAATLHARVANGERLGLTASATFGGSARAIEERAPAMPDVEPPDGIEPFVVPPGFVPITDSLDIRPATDDGWVHEALDMWDLDGRHIASGNQLRLALP